MSINDMAGIIVAKENPLKNMLVDYVGNKFSSEQDEGEILVTVQMIAEALATEFPEFMMVVAEENWARGYEQGLDDAKLYNTETKTNS
jgi:hypothetical protein